MIDFDVEIKTKIYFGKNKEEQIGAILSSYLVKKVFIVIGQGSVKRSGLLDSVLSKIDECNINYLLFEGVKANPDKLTADKANERCKKFQPDLILAIGGGSVIDTAKYCAVGYYYNGDTFAFNRHLDKPKKALPLGVILTIAASGSEMSTSCVIQDYDKNIKSGFNSELVRPLFAIENPELTYTVSKEQTAYGIVDILSHTLERFFNETNESPSLADSFALGLIKTVIEAGKIAINNPYDYNSRATLMLASSYSHNGITSLGKTSGLIVHQLEHALTACYPFVAHGAGLSILYPCWAKEYMKYDVKKFALLARNVFNLIGDDDTILAEQGIKALKDYFVLIGAPIDYKSVGIDHIDIDRLLKVLTNDGTRTISYHMKDIDKDIARTIYMKGI